MLKRSQVIGLPVILLEKGTYLGYSSDLLWQTENKEIKALEITASRWTQKKIYYSIRKVISMGLDAIMVKGKCAHAGRDGFGSTGKLLDLPVYDITGKLLGYIADMMFDPLTKKIIKIELAVSFFEDIVYGRPKLPVDIILSWGEVIMCKDGKGEGFYELPGM